MSIREKVVQLRIKGSSTMLNTCDSSLTKPTIDVRIKQILDKFKEDGSNPWSEQAEVLDLRINHKDEVDNQTPITGIFYKDRKKAITFSET